MRVRTVRKLHTCCTLTSLLPLCGDNPYLLSNLYVWQYFSCAIMIILALLFDLLINSFYNLWVETVGYNVHGVRNISL